MTDLATKSGAGEAESDDDTLVDDAPQPEDAETKDAAPADPSDGEVDATGDDTDAPAEPVDAEAGAEADDAPAESADGVEDEPSEDAAAADPVEDADEAGEPADADPDDDFDLAEFDDDDLDVDDDLAEFDDDDLDDAADVPAAAAAEAPTTPAPVAPAPVATAAAAAPVTAEAAEPTVPAGAVGGGPVDPVYAWAPSQPAPKKSRKPLWIGLAAGAGVIALVVASVALIAPGTSIAGVPVGFLPTAAATDAVQQRLATTTIVLTGEGGGAELTGADLGASVDASGLVAEAYAAHPMWNVTAWFPEPIDAAVFIDAEAANSALRAVAPELYTDPVDATLAYDTASQSYVTTPSETGTGIDVDAVRDALQQAFASGETRVELEATVSAVQADTPSYVADATADRLNDILDTAGFYVGSERTVPVSRARVASWLTVTAGERGTFDIAADAAAIDEVVAGLPEKVERKVVDATVITNSAGDVLREMSEGVTGRALGDTSTVADDFAAQLASGSGVYELPVTETEFTTTELERRVEVDLGTQTAHLYENDKVVGSYTISSGTDATPTPTGHFTVNAYTRMQDMGALCYNPKAVDSYCTEDVPWITWFAPDIAFHGASHFRSALGFQQSHGCVNMWDADAKFIYEWTATGTEVWVHA